MLSYKLSVFSKLSIIKPRGNTVKEASSVLIGVLPKCACADPPNSEMTGRLDSLHKGPISRYNRIHSETQKLQVYVLLTVHLTIFLDNDQLNAHLLYFTLSLL